MQSYLKRYYKLVGSWLHNNSPEQFMQLVTDYCALISKVSCSSHSSYSCCILHQCALALEFKTRLLVLRSCISASCSCSSVRRAPTSSRCCA